MDFETRDDETAQDSFRVIGAELASARLERGMQIQELAQLLRISKHHLKNLESGDFDLLPGSTYVSGYLRSYAREVGLDPVALPQRYRALLDDSQARPSYSFPVEKQQPQRSGAMMASIMVIFAVGGYGGWYAAGKPNLMAALVGDVPQDTVAMSPVESAVTEPDNLIVHDTEQTESGAGLVDSGIAALPENGETQPVQQAPLPEVDVAGGEGGTAPLVPAAETVAPDTDGAIAELAEGQGQAAPAAATDNALDTLAAAGGADGLAAAAPAALSAAAVSGDAGDGSPVQATDDLAAAPTEASDATTLQQGDDSVASSGVAYARQRVPEMEITVRATGISWVEIIRNDGEEVMTKLMREGETYVVDSRDRLYLSTGNAGGIELMFHDGSVQRVGESGEILRDLPLDADRLRNQL